MYSYLTKFRCTVCTGNIECRTESAGEYGGSVVQIRTWTCIMCSRERFNPELRTHEQPDRLVAMYKPIIEQNNEDGVWDYVVKVDPCLIKKKRSK